MRIRILLGLATVALSAGLVHAQSTEPGPPPQSQESNKTVQQYDVADGGVRETLESIVIPPKAQAPFTLTLETEWAKALNDGGTITLVNKRQIARDATGRIYQERRFLVPKDGQAESRMTAIQIADPNTHTLYNCFPLAREHTCELRAYAPSTAAVYRMEGPPTGPLPGDQGNAIHEELGKRFIAGLETVGGRDSLIYNPGVFGNDRTLTMQREYWFSPQLGINLLSIRTDPRIGKQTFTVTTLVLGEPDSTLFELPAGFRVVDLRQNIAPEAN